MIRRSTAQERNSERAIQYLLGEMRDEDRSLWEDRMFANSELFEVTEAAEYELIDRYVRGALKGDAAERFEQRLMALPSQRARVRIARALAADLASSVGAGPHQRSRKAIGRVVGLATAAAALIGLGLWWGGTMRRQQSPIVQQHPVETRSRPDARPTEVPSPEVFALALKPGLTRSAVGASVTETTFVPRTASTIRLDLHLTKDIPSRYDVAITTADGQSVWQASGLQPSAADGVSVLTAIVPSSVFPDGDYVVSVGGVDTAGRPQIADAYHLRIARQ
jgi:hypothetical protein